MRRFETRVSLWRGAQVLKFPIVFSGRSCTTPVPRTIYFHASTRQSSSTRTSSMANRVGGMFGAEGGEARARVQYIQEGQAELIPGVLFIDEVHMLDLECFTCLHRVLESEVSPIIVFATNRGRVKAQEGDEEHLHGIPADLLDRLMINVTTPHTSEDIIEILKIRSQAEEVQLADEAHSYLVEIAEERKSIRYAIQLMTPAKVLAQVSGREEITKSDIQQCEELFIDARTSAAESRGGAAMKQRTSEGHEATDTRK